MREIVFALGHHAALIKLAQGAAELGARPATQPPKPPAKLNMSLAMPRSSAGGLGHLGGLGTAVGNYFRDPANMARMIGMTGDLGRGFLGTVGAPGLFALSNLPRGFGEMSSILRGGIPMGDTPAQPQGR